MPAYNLEAAVEELIQAALDDPAREADLRHTHRMALKRLQSPDGSRWEKQEQQRLWALVQLLNSRIASRRLEVVDIDEEISRLERLTDAMASKP